MTLVPCPRACGRAPNCDDCRGTGEVEESFADAIALGDDPTVRMTREELTALRMSSRPPAASLEELGGVWLDDVPDDTPTQPSTPEAKRRNTPFPR